MSDADDTACHCGGTLVFDPTVEGETLGGLHVAGGNRCTRCKAQTLSKRSVPSGGWKLATSGRSLDAGGVRLRADGDGTAVMARIVRLPDLEAALRAIARGDADPMEIARKALEGS